jgi:putative inorganic carbon (HCO3(-)) transporter
VLVAGLAVVLVLVLISFWSPTSGLMLYIVWTFIRPPEVIPGFGGPLPLTRIYAAALIVAALLHIKFSRPRPFRSDVLNWSLLAFVFVNYLSALPGLSIGQSVATTNEFLPIVALYFLIVNLLDTPKRLRQCLWLYVASIGWVAVNGLLIFKGPLGGDLARAQAESMTFGNANNTAEQLVLVIPFVFALLMTERKWMARLALVAFLGVDIVLLIYTGSRGGLLELIAVLLFSAFQSKRSLALVSALVVLFLIVLSFAPAVYRERYATLPNILEDPQATRTTDGSAYGRVVGWYVACEIFRDRPLLGVGAGNFPRALERVYSYKGVHGWWEPHNLPGQVLAETGLLGVLSFGAFIYLLLRECSRTLREIARAPGTPELLPWVIRASRVAVFTLFVVGISDHDVYFLNWYLAGAFVVVCKYIVSAEKARALAPAKEVNSRLEFALASSEAGRASLSSRSGNRQPVDLMKHADG